MVIQVLLLLAGLALIVFGADYLVDGASSVARRLGVSEFVIGLTIVGMGTSAPELVVSFIGALQGNADIAVGNVVGSNIFNSLLILGVTALLLPMPITRSNRRRDIPINLGSALILVLLGLKHTLLGIGAADGLSRADGGIMLLLFAAYIWSCFRSDSHTEEGEAAGKTRRTGVALLVVAGGLAALIVGGRLFVDSATAIARSLGISDKFIAITILAGGTSLPELATCVVAAAKKKGQLALGNILGSNVFNILLILGGSALIHPLGFAGMTFADLGVLVLSALLIGTSAFTGRRNELDRIDGAILLVTWAAYMTWLICNL